MYYIGGLGIGTEMMAYNSIGGKQSFKIQVEHLGIDDHDMVALFNMFMDYETRFTPSYLTVKAVSKHAVRLTFEDGYTVTCSKFQNFFCLLCRGIKSLNFLLLHLFEGSI